MGPLHTPKRKNGGYSLIELLVVLAIIAVLVAVGVTTIGSKNKAAVKDMTQQLVSSLSDAQQLARTTGRTVTLHTQGATSSALVIDFEYQTPNPASPANLITIRGGGFSVASQGSSRSYAVPGILKTQATATGISNASLKNLSLVTDWDLFFVNANAVFQGAESSALTFSSSGQISQDCFATISSVSPGTSSPMGMVIVTRRNGIHAYYCSGETGAPWRSL